MLNEASLTKNESTDLSHNSKSKINLFTYLDNIINKNLKPTQFLIFQEDNTKTNENKKKQLILYKCERCGKIYSKLYRFQIHLRTHTGEKPFCCSICDKRFNENTNLKKHYKTHTQEKPFCCLFPNCDYKAKTKYQLKEHEIKHTIRNTFACDICDAKFSRKYKLKKHLKIHNERTVYKCTEPGCNKEYLLKESFNYHLKVHQSIKISKRVEDDLRRENCKENNDNKIFDIKKVFKSFKIDNNKSNLFSDVFKKLFPSEYENDYNLFQFN